MDTPQYAGYLFAYFTGADTAEEEQVYFARSRGNDIQNWEVLDGGKPALVSELGTGGVRDPFLIRAAGLPGEIAKFYLIGTDLHIFDTVREVGDFDAAWVEAQRNGSRSIVIWESQNLSDWSEPWLAEVSPPDAGNTWAPEVTFDESTQSYLVYWASKLWGDAELRDGNTYNRMLSSTTADFRSFAPAEVWFDPGHDVIDSTVVRESGEYFRFTKDERAANQSTPSGKFITLDKSHVLASTNYRFVADGIGRSADGSLDTGLERGEGPIIVRANDDSGWYLLIDEFGLRGYQLFFSPTIDAQFWQLLPLGGLPPECRHGSILPITQSEWDSLTPRLV
jgi:hypothetical protein